MKPLNDRHPNRPLLLCPDRKVPQEDWLPQTRYQLGLATAWTESGGWYKLTSLSDRTMSQCTGAYVYRGWHL